MVPENLKQVIVVRKDLNMRKGKMIAQGAHASLMSYLNALGNRGNMMMVYEWLQKHGQTKICVGVDSEQELLDLHKAAQSASLPCALVLDSARTEFKEPTYTALGIGPADVERINLLTGMLKLL
jgi:peptidyl-tRNA hydrolase, PTH2 family